MGKLNEVREELQQFNEAVVKLKQERQEKVQELVKQQRERQKVIMAGFGSQVDGRQTKPFNQAIEKLEKDIAGIDEQLELTEEVKKEKFTPMVQELKEERSKVAQENKKTIEDLEKNLFEAKFKFLKELEEATQEQKQLQQELDEYHTTISQFENDNKLTVPQFTVYNPDYLLHGGMKAPVAPTDNEIHKIVYGGNSIHRLPISFLVYKMSGEVFVNEKEAGKRLQELQKGDRK